MSAGVWLVLLGVVIVAFVAMRLRRYARFFSDEHWLEVARGLGPVKQAALERVIRDGEGEPRVQENDPRAFVSSAGLAIVYTVSEGAGGYVHHWSVGAVSGPTAHALGGAFVLFVAKLLGFSPSDLRCEVAPSTVHHAEVVLDAAQHAALAAAPAREVSREELAELRREILEARLRVARPPLERQSG